MTEQELQRMDELDEKIKNGTITIQEKLEFHDMYEEWIEEVIERKEEELEDLKTLQKMHKIFKDNLEKKC